MATAKIITVYTPQPPIPQPDKEEKFVDLRLTLDQAEVLRSLAGCEITSPKESFGTGSLERIFFALQEAGVGPSMRYKGMIPTRTALNERAWVWGPR